jgi:hypothetical protein
LKRASESSDSALAIWGKIVVAEKTSARKATLTAKLRRLANKPNFKNILASFNWPPHQTPPQPYAPYHPALYQRSKGSSKLLSDRR